MTVTTRKTFTDSHIAELKKGAKRRNEEQIVGNWIRRTNKALFLQLLNESTAPTSSALDAFVNTKDIADEDITNGNFTKEKVNQLDVFNKHIPLEVPKDNPTDIPFRGPPPRMDIT